MSDIASLLCVSAHGVRRSSWDCGQLPRFGLRTIFDLVVTVALDHNPLSCPFRILVFVAVRHYYTGEKNKRTLK